MTARRRTARLSLACALLLPHCSGTMTSAPAAASSPVATPSPSVVRLTSGVWLMAASRGPQSLLARSTDGATFSGETIIGLGGVPELAALDAGRVRIYVCGVGIVAHVSADEGRSWTREATVVAAGTLGARSLCDPSRVEAASRFIYKIQP